MTARPPDRYDVWNWFARRHLRTRAERGVYQSVVGALIEEPPTVAEIAWERNLDLEDVEDVLERFEAAGIVERLQSEREPRRYRWRRDMRYLQRGPDDPFAWIDPVCGMPVVGDTPYRATRPDGSERRFCSSLCLANFRASPDLFLRESSGGAVRIRRAG